jgi:hypothetical protein
MMNLKIESIEQPALATLDPLHLLQDNLRCHLPTMEFPTLLQFGQRAPSVSKIVFAIIIDIVVFMIIPIITIPTNAITRE